MSGALLGNAMQAHRAGDHATAQAMYLDVLQANPANFGALYSLGVSYCQQGEQARGVPILEQALILRPDHAEAHCNLANALNALSRHEEAITHSEQALALDPASAEAHNILGNALQALARHDEAIARYAQALALKPALVEANRNLANALYALGRFDEAIAYGELAVALDPSFAEAYNNLGNALHTVDRQDEAIARYEQALALMPASAEAHYNLGNALQSLDRHREASGYYEQALAINPAFAEAYNNLGTTLHELGRHEEAIARFEKALALKPAYADAYNNLGQVLHALRRNDEAIARYRQALAVSPDFAGAELNMSLALLSLGRFAEGWPPYEYRSQVEGGAERPDWQRPAWSGTKDIAGKTILLHAEQGLGDTIQFSRYAALVAQHGARVILEVQPALHTLLADLLGPHQVVARGEPLPEFDYHCPLLSLPLAFGTSLDTIPSCVPYLAAPRDASAKWEATLGPKDKLRVGIAWSGSPGHKNDRNRSIPLHRLLPLLTAGFRLVSLQQEVRAKDQEVLDAHPEILHIGGKLRDFTDTAALVTLLDLVISVDTSVVHLGGTLGKPVWILLPFAPDWRWMLDRDDSPWYPTARLFRQPRIGDWDSVIRTVGERLAVFGR